MQVKTKGTKETINHNFQMGFGDAPEGKIIYRIKERELGKGMTELYNKEPAQTPWAERTLPLP